MGATWDTLVGKVREALLERCTAGASSSTVPELVEASGLPETTVRQALLDLVAAGLADYPPEERWVPATPIPEAKPPRRTVTPKPKPPKAAPRPKPQPKPQPKATGPQVDLERWLYIARRLVEGATCKAIARELGVTGQAVSYYRRQLLPPKAPIPRDLEARARAHAKRLAHGGR